MTEAQKIDDGGPAFPTRAGDGEWYESETHADGSATYKYGSRTGMSLRDWFAGQAICGMIANPDLPVDERYCYQVADAMLAARKAVVNRV